MSPDLAFLAALFNGPLARADAIVLLAGEDGEARLETACGLLAQDAAPTLVITGKREDAHRLHGEAMVKGVNPGIIRVDNEATNTREQAEDVVAMAKVSGWRSLILVASAYHTPRAALTFVAALQARGMDDVRLVPVPSAGKWFDAVPGMTDTRLERLAVELDKCATYQARGDVASWEEGLAYLRSLEDDDASRTVAR